MATTRLSTGGKTQENHQHTQQRFVALLRHSLSNSMSAFLAVVVSPITGFFLPLFFFFPFRFSTFFHFPFFSSLSLPMTHI